MHFKDKRVLTIKTTDDMLKILNAKGNPLSSYKKGSKITVYNKMEKDYSYVLAENPGKNFAEGFEPEVLQGGLRTLQKVEYVSVDVSFERGDKMESTMVPVLNLMLKNNFEVIKINHERMAILFKNLNIE